MTLILLYGENYWPGTQSRRAGLANLQAFIQSDHWACQACFSLLCASVRTQWCPKRCIHNLYQRMKNNHDSSDYRSLRFPEFSFSNDQMEIITVATNCTATPNTNIPRSANKSFVRLISNCWLAESCYIVVVNKFYSLVIWKWSNVQGLKFEAGESETRLCQLCSIGGNHFKHSCDTISSSWCTTCSSSIPMGGWEFIHQHFPDL